MWGGVCFATLSSPLEEYGNSEFGEFHYSSHIVFLSIVFPLLMGNPPHHSKHKTSFCNSNGFFLF